MAIINHLLQRSTFLSRKKWTNFHFCDIQKGEIEIILCPEKFQIEIFSKVDQYRAGAMDKFVPEYDPT